MWKVRNQKIVSELAKITYKANKKRNLLTIVAVVLTTFLISVILSLGMSYWDTISLRQVRMSGMDYDIELTEPRENQVNTIRSMDNVKYAGIAVKCAIGSTYEDNQLDKLKLYWLDDTCWTKQTIPALETYTGSYPSEEDEIMLSNSALNDMGITNPQIGMEVPISYFSLDEDSSEESNEKTFVLCGWYSDYSGTCCGYISEEFFKTTGVKQTDITQGTLKITLVNPLYSKEDIINMQNEIDLSRHQIIDADYDTISNFCKICIGLLGMLLMVFFSGYLFIHNTLYLSITKDIRYYGQLKTLGMTSVQLQKLVYMQMIWNSFVGIPIGLILSAIVAKGTIPQILHIVNPTINSADVIDVRLWTFLLAAIFSFVTTLVSSNKPVKLVKDCSPVESLNYIVVSNKNRQKKRESGSIASMAKQNIFRDKKQALIILLSFSIAVSLFMSVNTIIYENDAKLILNNIYNYDMRILNQTMLDENKQQVITDNMIVQIEKIDGVKKVRKVISTLATVPYQEEVYGEYYEELYQSRYSPGDYETDIESYKENPEDSLFTCRFIAIDESEFDRINKNMGNKINKNDFKQGSIALATKMFTNGDNGIPQKTVRFYLPEGIEPQKEYSILIDSVIDDCPAYYAAGYTPDLIVSEKFAEKLLGNTFTELIYVEYQNAFSVETENSIREIIDSNNLLSYESKLERYSEMKNSENQITVLGSSIGFIVLLLAVLNYLNMMAASIQNRSKEFAILESIGMTTKQIRQMIILEGLEYAIMSLILSVIIGVPLSYIVFSGLNIYSLPFVVPWFNNLVLFLVIILICMSAPVILLKNMNRLTIIEQLRQSEN